ncbi:ABC transporter substrate-binding protein [Bordetella hinzii]|uniref:ABC transporter substrate-binding protein n=1 Tax=Bordetella hinzii TaxID=103855 RepID=UPI00045A1810|nr:sugar ABC transporter substrate-binding protein [Bordetella hinzii]KCB45977.1 ABC transporter, solute-binding protein [Bordetella hinzii 4161]
MRKLIVASLLGALFTPLAGAQDTVTLTYGDWQLAQEVWGKSLNQVIDQFEKEHPGIKVKREPVPLGQRDVKYSTAIRAGAGPDVFALDANPVRQYIAEGWVRDLTPQVQQAGGAQFLSDFYPIALEPVTVDKKIYGLPMNTVAMVLVYNNQLFKEAGIDGPPKTWTAFREDARKLTRSSTGGQAIDRWGFGFVLAPAGFDLRFSAMLRGFGGDFVTPDGKHSALNTPQSKAAFNLLLDMVEKDKSIPPGVTQVDANGARRLLANQTTAMKIGTTWSLPEVSAMNPKLDGWHTLGLAPIPQPEGSTEKIRTTLFQKSIFVNKNSKHPEQAWLLAKYLTDAAAMKTWYDFNNMLSSRRSVNEGYDKISGSESARIVSAEIEHGAFLPQTPKWPQIQEAFRQNLQAAVAGSKTREQALDDAHKQAEALLQQP